MWFRHILSTKTRFRAEEVSGSNEPGGTLHVSPRALRQLERLQLNASRYLRGHAVGLRSSLRRTPAIDFRGHRIYTPGEDLRFVDWKASARQEHIFVRQGEQPKEATVYLLLDCSASMGWGLPPKSSAALSLAAAIGYTALAHGDRLLVQPLSMRDGNRAEPGIKVPPPLGPITGKGQYPSLLKYLTYLHFRGQTDLNPSILEFKQRILVGGLTFILSDLLDLWIDGKASLYHALEHLPAPTWDVNVIHLLHSEEVTPNLHGEFEMRDVETGQAINYDVTDKALQEYQQRMQEWCNELSLACVEANAYYTLLHSDRSLDRVMIPQLRELNILTPL